MSGLWVALVLAAAGSTSVDGAVTASGQLAQRQSASVSAGVHARVDVERDFGRFFATGHASLIFRGGTDTASLQDLGSRLTFGYRPTGFVERVFLEVIPFNSSVRLPYFDWANVWGAQMLPFGPLMPMLTGQVETKAGAFWLSARFKSLLDPLSQLQKLAPDFFVGADFAFTPAVRLEVKGGWFNFGLNPPLGSLGISLPNVGGGSGARLSWTWNEAVGPAVDFVTYATDPLRFERFFAAETRRSPFAAWVALEGGAGAQQLADPDSFGKGKLEPMGWIDLQARIRLRDVRLFGTARVQSMSFLVFDRHGAIPNSALARGTETTPSVTGILGVDWTIRALRLTPGLLVRLTQFASMRWPDPIAGGNNPPPVRPSILVVGPNGWLSAHPRDQPVLPSLTVKFSTRWDVVSFASLVFELEVAKDFNEPAPPFGVDITPIDTSIVSVNAQLFLQARF